MSNSSVNASTYDITIQFDESDIEKIRNHKYDFVECLSWALDAVDTSFLGDEFYYGVRSCILLYSYYSGKVFLLDWTDAEEILMAGEPLTLTACELDEYNLTEEEVEDLLNG